VSIGLVVRMFGDETAEGDLGERGFDFMFETTPDLIRLAVARLETGEFAFDRGHKGLHRTIEDTEDFPDVNLLFVSGERITPGGTFFGFDDPAFTEALEDFLEVALREVLGLGQGMNREGFARMGQRQDRSQAIVGFLRNLHISD
jgi:hypothetical protein